MMFLLFYFFLSILRLKFWDSKGAVGDDKFMHYVQTYPITKCLKLSSVLWMY